MAEPDPQDKDILPVILGGDVGAYTLGLECYEAFGCKSLCVANEPVDVISKSVIFEIERIPPALDDAELLAILRGIAALHPNHHLVLLANTDRYASFCASNFEALTEHFVVPFPSANTIDLLGRKDSFAEVCAAVGAKTPETVVVDLAYTNDRDWQPPNINFDFPVVAKAASGDAYDRISFPGKEKIWFVDNIEELDRLWQTLSLAGYRDRFLVQEMIPGDDSCMRSLTFYVDSSGRTTLRAAARVLLQDPSPTMIGNPVAMITEEYPELWELAEKILTAGQYRGFANFDIKVDPRNNTPVFLEVNPRIGRNSYYVAAAGVNPMVPMVRDLVDGQAVTPEDATGRVLYTLVPVRLIQKYLRDPELQEQVQELVDTDRVVDPLDSPIETSRQRRATAALQKLNYYRKFKKFTRSED